VRPAAAQTRCAPHAHAAAVLHTLRTYWGAPIVLLVLAVGLALLGTLAFDPVPWSGWMAFAIVSVVISLLVVAELLTCILAFLVGLSFMLLFGI
jgi:hypothetical protein